MIIMNESNPTNTQMRMTRMRMRMDDKFFVFVLIILIYNTFANKFKPTGIDRHCFGWIERMQTITVLLPIVLRHPSSIIHLSSSVYYIILFSYILLNALCISTSANVSNLQYSNNAFLVAFVVSSSSSLSSSC